LSPAGPATAEETGAVPSPGAQESSSVWRNRSPRSSWRPALGREASLAVQPSRTWDHRLDASSGRPVDSAGALIAASVRAYGSCVGHPAPVQTIRLWIDGEMGEFAMM
jgi:hypothetical protein